MSAWFYEPTLPANFTAAGGEAGLGEIVDAAAQQMRLVDNTNASYRAMYDAYDARIAAIRAATGEGVENPLAIAERLDFETMRQPRRPAWETDPYAELKDGPAMPTNAQREGQKFSEWLVEMERRHPDQAATIRAGEPIRTDAEQLAKKADEDLARLLGSRPGVMGIAATLAGGIEGQLSDPLQVATFAIGGGPGAGRTVAARVLNVALKEALVNGAVEASLQPAVQDWRRQAGLPSGFAEGVKNTLFAAGAGAVLGSGAEALGLAARRIFKGEALDMAAAEVAKAPLSIDMKLGLEGNVEKAAAALKPIREAVAPEARAAIDRIETDAALPVPDGARPDLHAKNLERAAAAIARPETVAFEPDIDPQKIERIVREILPDAPTARPVETRSLTDFLISAGGLQDQGGEITALGLQNVAQSFKGRLVRETGLKLDRARELAAEDGFFDHRYGTPEAAVEKSTVADLLDELDADQRRGLQTADDGGRRYVEARVDELLKIVGPEVDEKIVARAVERAERDGMDLLAAFDAEAIGAERAGLMELRNRERISDAENAAFDAEIERELRAQTTLTREEQAAIDRAYAENGPASPELSALIAKGTYPAPRDLLLYRGESRAAANADEFISASFSRNTAANFAAGKPIAFVVPQGTPIYSPRSGISGGEVLLRQADLDAVRRADPMMPEEPFPEFAEIPDDELLTSADLDKVDPDTLIPFFDDGEPVTAAQMADDLDELAGLFQLTEACRV